ncbi:MAG: choice-of-anchor A family protein, partial [Ruminococcus sp.]|nr:choice-of-anchor A family protein [Ruminococcus sp.]
MKKTLGKRLISGVTSALLAVSAFAQSAIPIGELSMLRAKAATNLGSLGPAEDVTLLIGSKPQDPDGNVYTGLDTVDKVVAQYSKDYALGIASQFCLFLADDFIPHESDAEGRVAVGGSIDTSNFPYDSYNIGKGHYVNNDMSVDLEKLLLGNKDFAHLIWGAEGDSPKLGGAVNKNSQRLTAVQTDAGVEYVKANFSSSLDTFYNAKLIDIKAQIDMLKSRSNTISSKKNQFDMAVDDISVVDYLEKVPTVVTLTYNGDATKPTETVYFNLDDLSDEQYEQFKNATIIRFENIPKLENPRKLSQVNSAAGEKEEEATWNYSYIVVNDSRKGDIIMGHQINAKDNGWSAKQYTMIKGFDADKAINVSNGSGDWLAYNPETGAKDYPLSVFSDPNGNGTTGKNNEAGVSSLLYNCPNASRVIFASSTQGTVLAPNAHITDSTFLKKNNLLPKDWTITVRDGENPHISGAVIAKSFEGNMEFGYRPFTGPSAILGISSTYSLYMHKVDQDNDPISEVLLQNAGFELVPLKQDSNGNYVKDEETGLYEADGDVIPFAVVEDGKLKVNNVTSGKYLIRETKAPLGYSRDTTVRYFIDISEPDSRKATYSVPLKDMKKEYIYKVGGTDDVPNSIKGITAEELEADKDNYIPAETSKKTYTYKVELDGFGTNGIVAVAINGYGNYWVNGTTGTIDFYDVDEISEDTEPIESLQFTGNDKWLQFEGFKDETKNNAKKAVITVVSSNEIDFTNDGVKNSIQYTKDWENWTSLTLKLSEDSPVEYTSPITRYYKKYDESAEHEKDEIAIELATGDKVLGHTYQVQPEVSPIDYDNVTIAIYKNEAVDGEFADNPFDASQTGVTKIAEHTYSGLNNISNEIKNKDNIYVFDVSVDKSKPVEGKDGLTRYEAVINQVKMTDKNGKTTTLKKGDEGFDSFKIHTVTKIENADGTEIEGRKPLTNLIYDSKFIPMEDGVYTVTDKGAATITGMGGNKTVDNAFYEMKFGQDGKIVSARYAVPAADRVIFGAAKTVGEITTDLVRTDGKNDNTWDEWYGFDPDDGKLKRWTPKRNSETGAWESVGTAVRVVDEDCGVYRINGELYVAVYDDGNTMIYELAEVNFEPKQVQQEGFGPVPGMTINVPAVTSKEALETKAELVVNEYVITIDDDVAESNINLTYAFSEDESIKLKNKKTEVPINVSKRALGSSKDSLLGGATLKVSVDMTKEKELDTFKEKFADLKVEQDSKEIKFELVNTDEEISVEFVTSNKFETQIKGLPNGHYILSESAVPDKYIVAEPIKFEVADGVIVDVNLGDDKENYFDKFEKDEKASETDGKDVYVKHYENELYEDKVGDTYVKETSDSLVMIDAHETLSVSKVDIADIDKETAKELAGADIEFRRINVATDGTLSEAETYLDRWVSGNEPHVIKPTKRVLNPAYATDKTQEQYIRVPASIPNGYYRFREISAPDGYKSVANVYVKIEGYKIVDILKLVTDPTTGKRTFESAERNDAVKDVDGNLTIGDTASEIVISKYDTETNLLEGAEIKISLDLTSVKADAMEAVTAQFDKVTVEQGSNTFDKETKDIDGFSFVNTKDEKSITFTSTDVDAIFKNLPDGKYVFSEITPPEGFQSASDIKFTVNNGVITEIVLDETADDVKDGVYNITEEDEEGNIVTVELNKITSGQTTDTVVMVDRANGVLQISKTDMTGNKIAGAKMSLKKAELNADTNVVTVGDSVAAWTSNDKDLRDVKIEEGYYLLTEEAAPAGYTVIEAKILVHVDNNANIDEVYTVDSDNKATLVDEENEVSYVETDGDAIIVKDTLSSIHVSKKVVGGSEIADVTLKLQLDTEGLSPAAIEAAQKAFDKVTVEQGTGENKKTGNRIPGYSKVKDENGIYVTFNSAGMVAGKTVDTVINGLPDGKYILEEIAVPKDKDGNAKYVKAEPINLVVEKGIIKSIEIDEKDKDNYAEGENVVGTSQVTGVVMRDATTTVKSTTTESTTTASTTTESTTTESTTTASTTTESTTTACSWAGSTAWGWGGGGG